MRNIIFVFIVLILAQAVVYFPQPILESIAVYFRVDKSDAVLVMSVVFGMFCIVPLFAGAILQYINPKKMLLSALGVIFLAQVGFVFIYTYYPNFWVFLGFRSIQAIFFPFVSLALFTTVQKSDNKEKMLGIYVGCVIIGGTIGRLLGGYIESYYGMIYVFMTFGFGIFMALILSLKIAVYDAQYIPLSNLSKDIFKDKESYIVFVGVFIMYFMFQSIVNTLPFRLKELNSDTSTLKISLVYLSYISGIVVSVSSGAILYIFKNEKLVVLIGFFIFLLGILGFYLNIHTSISMIVLCFGMFMVTIFYSILNAKNPSYFKSGLYLFFYYGGGALGSYLGALTYSKYGFDTLIFIALILCILGIVLSIIAMYDKQIKA